MLVNGINGIFPEKLIILVEAIPPLRLLPKSRNYETFIPTFLRFRLLFQKRFRYSLGQVSGSHESDERLYYHANDIEVSGYRLFRGYDRMTIIDLSSPRDLWYPHNCQRDKVYPYKSC